MQCQAANRSRWGAQLVGVEFWRRLLGCVLEVFCDVEGITRFSNKVGLKTDFEEVPALGKWWVDITGLAIRGVLPDRGYVLVQFVGGLVQFDCISSSSLTRQILYFRSRYGISH
jgi:hypothetical protein